MNSQTAAVPSTSPRTGSRISTPNPNDVICGRGGLANRHDGNLKYRTLVKSNLDLYHSSPKMKKLLLAKSMVEAIRKQQPPGRFLNKTPSGKAWVEIEAKKAVRKTSQTFRDITLEERRKEEAQSLFSSLETIWDDESRVEGSLLRGVSGSSEPSLEDADCPVQGLLRRDASEFSSEGSLDDDPFPVQGSDVLLGDELDFADMKLDDDLPAQGTDAAASSRPLEARHSNSELELGQWLEQVSFRSISEAQ